MPRRKYCEHPLKHVKSTRVPKGIVAVSAQLSKILMSSTVHNSTKSEDKIFSNYLILTQVNEI